MCSRCDLRGKDYGVGVLRIQQPRRKEADATLKNARFHGGQVSGFIYGDKKGRFHDGEYITTSLIEKVEVTTKNSRYVVELKEEF